MYKAFFGLAKAPFGASPDPGFLYMMAHTREALAGLQHGIAARKGIIILTGEVGTGKTTVLRAALGGFNNDVVSTAFVFNPRLDVLDFLEFVLIDFGLTPTSRTKSGMLIQLNNWFLACYSRGLTCLIIVDEAQNCSWELLEEIRLLTNLETASEKLVQVILSGQPELEAILRQAEVRQLRQRVALWCRTFALSARETAEYVEERLRLAGARQRIFLPEALSLIASESQGIPRIINLICDHTLVSAYVQRIRTIPAGLVTAVLQEMDLDRTDLREYSR